MDPADLVARFTVITVEGEGQTRLDMVRRTAFELAHLIDDLADDGREKSTAITKLEEATFWANRAIATTLRNAATLRDKSSQS